VGNRNQAHPSKIGQLEKAGTAEKSISQSQVKLTAQFYMDLILDYAKEG
jgi:hypothetical protein